MELLTTNTLQKIYKYILLLMTLNSCTYNYIEDEALPELVSYKQHIQVIFNNNCIACHNGQYTLPDLRAEESFEALTSGEYINSEIPSESKLILKIKDNHPYTDIPTQREIDLILNWIEQGALNN